MTNGHAKTAKQIYLYRFLRQPFPENLDLGYQPLFFSKKSQASTKLKRTIGKYHQVNKRRTKRLPTVQKKRNYHNTAVT